VVVLLISGAVFVILDTIKVLIYREWTFELTTYLWPVPSRRRKLAEKKKAAICTVLVYFILFYFFCLH